MDQEKTCILIDDDEDDHYFFRAALLAQGIPIACTYYLKPKEALEKISQHRGVKPTYIFIDLNMPQLTGLECLGILKRTPAVSDIPVVMYSTSASPNDIEACKQLGALAYLVKPASIEELASGLSPFFVP